MKPNKDAAEVARIAAFDRAQRTLDRMRIESGDPLMILKEEFDDVIYCLSARIIHLESVCASVLPALDHPPRECAFCRRDFASHSPECPVSILKSVVLNEEAK